MQNEYLEGFECLLPQTERILPSYNDFIGKKYGDLTVIRLLRKNNRNILDCKCKCGRHEYLYRWQLKDKLSCSVCGKYSDQYILKTKDLDINFFNELKTSNEDFEITYKYANDLLKKQKHRCAYTGHILFAQENCNNCLLDKINPQKGFVKNNVQWVVKQIAIMKGELTDKQFLNICKKIFIRNSTLQTNKTINCKNHLQKKFL